MRDAWKILAVAVLLLVAWAMSGCKGPDSAARVLSTFEVAYTDGSGTIDGAHAGTLDVAYGADSTYSGAGSSDADWHAWTFSISPLAALHDPHAATREVIERQYQLALVQDEARRADERRAAEEIQCQLAIARDEARRAAEERAKLLPFVEKAPGADASEPVSASDAGEGGSAPAPDLPWWKDGALLIGYATVIGSVLAGLVMGWKRVHPAKE